MKTCSECQGMMKEFTNKTPEGVDYHYYKCSKCGEEIVDLKQLHQVAERYRILKNYHVKLSQWGLSLGMRFPKEIAERYKLKEEEEVVIIPEEKGMRIIPA